MTLFVVDSQNVLGKSVKEAGSYNVKILPDSEYKKQKKKIRIWLHLIMK